MQLVEFEACVVTGRRKSCSCHKSCTSSGMVRKPGLLSSPSRKKLHSGTLRTVASFAQVMSHAQAVPDCSM